VFHKPENRTDGKEFFFNKYPLKGDGFFDADVAAAGNGTTDEHRFTPIS
jgi:hypothetical protein